MACENQTSLAAFVLLGLPYPKKLHAVVFLFFLLIYLLTITGNSLVILAVATKTQLQKPMYWFLCHLAILDISMSSVIVPKMISGFVDGGQVISLQGCMVQLFCYHFLGCSEFFLYTVMAYDRFLAICRPLHYNTIMTSRACFCLSIGAWLGGCLHSVIETTVTFWLPYGLHEEIDYIFCDIPAMLKLACADTAFNEVFTLVDIGLVAVACILLILTTYAYVISAILKIRSVEGRRRAFSTCAAHLTVVVICYVPLAINYLRPGAQDLLNGVIGVFYTTLTPFLNPLIYTLRNQEMKNAIFSMKDSNS